MREVINEVIDKDPFLKFIKNYAENIVVGFAHLGRAEVLGLLPTNRLIWLVF